MPLTVGLKAFLNHYKKAHKLTALPLPSVPYDSGAILSAINQVNAKTATATGNGNGSPTVVLAGPPPAPPQAPLAANNANASLALVANAFLAQAGPPPAVGAQPPAAL